MLILLKTIPWILTIPISWSWTYKYLFFFVFQKNNKNCLKNCLKDPSSKFVILILWFPTVLNSADLVLSLPCRCSLANCAELPSTILKSTELYSTSAILLKKYLDDDSNYAELCDFFINLLISLIYALIVTVVLNPVMWICTQICLTE